MASGALFRLSAGLGIPALRMLGFWALVAVGVVGARAAARQQAAAGRRQVEAAVQVVAGRGAAVVLLVRPVAGPGEALAVVFPHRVAVLWLDAMADYGRGFLARRRLEAGRRRTLAAVAVVREALGGAGPEVEGCLVLLRRRAPAGGEAGQPPVVNPEGLAALLERWGRSGAADAGEARAAGEVRDSVAEVLRRRFGTA